MILHSTPCAARDDVYSHIRSHHTALIRILLCVASDTSGRLLLRESLPTFRHKRDPKTFRTLQEKRNLLCRQYMAEIVFSYMHPSV